MNCLICDVVILAESPSLPRRRQRVIRRRAATPTKEETVIMSRCLVTTIIKGQAVTNLLDDTASNGHRLYNTNNSNSHAASQVYAIVSGRCAC